MSNNPSKSDTGKNSRREFLKSSTAAVVGASVAGNLGIVRSAHAAGSDVIKIALIGCGGRGTGAAVNALSTKVNVRLVAMADTFKDRLENSLRAITSRCKERVDVPEERKFTDFDGYQKAIDCGVDLVLLVTPPGFRPMQFEAAVAAGKHVFMEKPLAVDAPGVRRILATNEEAKRKNLLVSVGFFLPVETNHREVIKRVNDGVLGKIQFMRVYCNTGGVWVRPREPGQTEMEYQMRNWYYFNWLSGDLIVEQHVHGLDIANCVMKGHPVRANGMGGRQVRVGKDYGEIFDHHTVEFDYADGSKLFSFSRHIPGCTMQYGEHPHGTKGYADMGLPRSALYVNGQEPMHWKRGPDGHQLQHDKLFAALAAGERYNEADAGAVSTMIAVMGRMATYSGKVVTWDEAINSNLDLSPKSYTWDAEPPVKPGKDGLYACAMPGVTKAW